MFARKVVCVVFQVKRPVKTYFDHEAKPQVSARVFARWNVCQDGPRVRREVSGECRGPLEAMTWRLACLSCVKLLVSIRFLAVSIRVCYDFQQVLLYRYGLNPY